MSTAPRSIAGLESVTSGTISVGSRVVNQLPQKDRDIETVFQNYALYPHMTLRLNLAFGLQQRKTRGASASPRPQRNPGKRPTPRISPAGAQHQPGLGDRH